MSLSKKALKKTSLGEKVELPDHRQIRKRAAEILQKFLKWAGMLLFTGSDVSLYAGCSKLKKNNF